MLKAERAKNQVCYKGEKAFDNVGKKVNRIFNQLVS